MQLPSNHRDRKRSVTHSESIEWTLKQTETRVLSSSTLFVFSSGLKIIKNDGNSFSRINLWNVLLLAAICFYLLFSTQKSISGKKKLKESIPLIKSNLHQSVWKLHFLTDFIGLIKYAATRLFRTVYSRLVVLSEMFLQKKFIWKLFITQWAFEFEPISMSSNMTDALHLLRKLLSAYFAFKWFFASVRAIMFNHFAILFHSKFTSIVCTFVTSLWIFFKVHFYRFQTDDVLSYIHTILSRVQIKQKIFKGVWNTCFHNLDFCRNDIHPYPVSLKSNAQFRWWRLHASDLHFLRLNLW